MTIRTSFAAIEGAHLLSLLGQLREMLSAQIMGEADHDPALSRLTPDPYPSDAAAGRSFAELTRDELLDRRSAEIAVVEQALAPFGALAATPDTATDRHDVDIADADLGAWMRTINALRLVLATRIGIVDDDDIDEDDPRRGVYDWLGYRLELLVQAADALD